MCTLLSRNNATNPHLVIPDFFTDGKYHHLIITHNGLVIEFYIDIITTIYMSNLTLGFALF